MAWEFRRRHRWGWMALIGYFAFMATIRLLILRGQRVELEDSQSFALAVVVPLTATFLYFLGVFTFGLTGDLSARQSMYPARMFTLPVTTGALAGWPMLYGTATMVILWLATRFLAVWPSDIEVPMIWPALLAATFLAWAQALTWMPYGLPGLRVAVTVLWLMVIEAVIMVALELKAGEPVMLGILAPHVPLAYVVARIAVGRARHGDGPDWRGRFGRTAELRSRHRQPFPSPARAQAWFEWRLHGRSLPAMVAIVVPLELGLLFLFSDTPVILFETLLFVLLTPPFMAAFVAATVSQSTSPVRDSYGVTALMATRPMTNAALIAAKLKATIRSTLAAWLVVVVAIPVALRLSGTWPVVREWMGDGIEAMGISRAIVTALLGFAALLASTWKQLVQSLFIGLTGREWVVKASVFLTLSLLAIIGPVANRIHGDKILQGALWNAIPWMLAVLVALKIGAAAWIALRLDRSRLLSDRTLVGGAASWCVAVLALHGLLAWLVPSVLVPRYILALVAILEIPLVRLSAAPLALAWNRHR
jgi:hypothetical protein